MRERRWGGEEVHYLCSCCNGGLFVLGVGAGREEGWGLGCILNGRCWQMPVSALLGSSPITSPCEFEAVWFSKFS